VSDIREQIKKAESERDRLAHLRQDTMRRLVSTSKQAEATLRYAEKELRRVESLPASPATERETLMALLRCEGARNNLMLIEKLKTMEIDQALTPSAFQHFDEILARTQFIAAEFNVVRYEPILRAIDAVLDPQKEEEVSPEKVEDSPLKGGAAPVRPIPPPRKLGATGAFPSPLNKVGSPRAVPGTRPGTPPRPGVLGTGPLARNPVSPIQRTRAGTDRLSMESQLQGRLEGALKDAIADAEVVDKLKTLRDRVRDVQASLAPLRGDAPGLVSELLPDATAAIRQLSGKVYMVNRAIAVLGDLGQELAFESPVADESLTRFLQSFEDGDSTGNSSDRMERIKGLFRR
jgi:hypothetical protein